MLCGERRPMRVRGVWLLTLAGLMMAGLVFGFQNAPKAWREYPAFEYNDFPVPSDYQEKTEWAFGRLMYPNTTNPNIWGIGGFRRFRGFGGDWREGGRGVFWTMDYPRSDRHFALAIRRLTRLHVRSVEQPVNLDEGGQFDWPWLYGVEVGHRSAPSAPPRRHIATANRTARPRRDCPAAPPSAHAGASAAGWPARNAGPSADNPWSRTRRARPRASRRRTRGSGGTPQSPRCSDWWCSGTSNARTPIPSSLDNRKEPENRCTRTQGIRATPSAHFENRRPARPS